MTGSRRHGIWPRAVKQTSPSGSTKATFTDARQAWDVVLFVGLMAFGKSGLLVWSGLGLIGRFPLIHAHAIENFTRFHLVHVDAAGVRRLLIPATQAIAAEAGEFHHVDVLHIRPVFHQVLTQAAKGRRFEFHAGLFIHVRLLLFLAGYNMRLR